MKKRIHNMKDCMNLNKECTKTEKKKSQKNLNQKIEYKLLKRLNEEKKNERECFDWEMNLIFQEQKRKSELNDFKALVDIDECEEKNIKDKMESRERVNG